MKKLKRNNKGVAMVIALIAILFISVLCSSLLYMSYLNNRMKTTRRYSTDNFYTAEYALDDMLSQIQQYASVQDDPRADLEDFLSDDGSTLNTAHLQSLIGVAADMPGVFDDGGSIVVDSVYTSGNYSSSGSSIWLRGVRITSTTNEASGSLKSSIVTDIELRFPAKASGSGKLNDFSILTDSPIYITASSQYFCGDLYCIANDNETIGSGVAFKVGGRGIVNVLGDFNFFDGDLVVEGNGVLYLSGNTYVHGDVKVANSATLTVGGTLYVKGDVDGTANKTSSGSIKDGGEGVNWTFYEDKYSNGLASHLINPYMHIHLSTGSSSIGYDYIGTINNAKVTQDQFAHLITGQAKDAVLETTSSRGYLATVTVGERDISSIYVTNQVEHNFENTLVISAVPLANFHGTVKNCTVLNIFPQEDKHGLLYIGDTQQHANAWGTMDDEAYEIAKDIVFSAQADKNFSGSTMSFGVPASGGASTTGETSVAGLLMSDKEPVAGTSDTYTLGTYTIKETTGGDTNSPAKYYYEKDDQMHNFFAYGNFLADDIDVKLGEFMYGASGSEEEGASTQPKVFLYNWYKE